MPSLTDKLRALGVQLGTQEIEKPKIRNPYSIDKVLDGKIIATSLGEIFSVENTYPIEYCIGASPLGLLADLEILSSWIGQNNIKSLPPEAFTFIDIETTGLSGGTGTFAFLIGIGRYIGNEFRIVQVFLREPNEEPAQLLALEQYMGNSQALVSFNGKSFDIPILITRYTLHHWLHPFQNKAHIDLLHLSRRLWRDRIPNRMLSNLEFNILGVSRSEEDIPGWMIPSLYFDFLRDGDARPLKRVFYHNLMDVLSMAALLNFIASLLSKPTLPGEVHNSDLIAIAGIFEEIGDFDSAINLYNNALYAFKHSEVSGQERVFLKAIDRLACIHKLHHNYSTAIELWKQAANLHQFNPCIELAKYYEHKQKDFTGAIYWTRFALELLDNQTNSIEPATSETRFHRDLQRHNLEHRLERLSKKALRNT